MRAHATEKYSLNRNWIIPVGIALIMTAMVTFINWVMTDQALQAQRVDRNEITKLIIQYVISIAADIAVIGEALKETLTYFTPEGVGQPRWLGGKFIKWDEIETVVGYSRFIRLNHIEFKGHGKRLMINTLYYGEMGALLALIRSHVPSEKWN